MLQALKDRLRPIKKAVLGQEVKLDRDLVAKNYLKGNGIEVGALHRPLRVQPGMNVKYVDRMNQSDLRKQYPELSELSLVHVDIIDNGEQLMTIAPASQDFVIANHFLEHCQDPIGATKNMLRVTRAGGVLFMAVPDKRFTFDRDRPITTVDHMVQDHVNGPDASRLGHFEEQVRLVEKLDGSAADEMLQKMLKMDYSIHFHVWDQDSFFKLLTTMQQMFSFEIEILMQNGEEVLTVLRKR